MVDASEHRALGIKTYNRCWELLEMESRTRDEDLELLRTAFASRYHWFYAGGPEQIAIGDWMISRAAAASNEPALSVEFALLANDAAHNFDAPEWLVASCAEGLASAYAALGDGDERQRWYARAQQLVTEIKDREDRELIAEQLSSVPDVVR